MTIFGYQIISNKQIVDNMTEVQVVGPTKTLTVKAKIDTGAYRSSLDQRLAEDLGLLADHNVVEIKKVANSLGETTRPIVKAKLIIQGVEYETQIAVMDRKKLLFPLIIGRKDLKGFLVKPDPDFTH